MRKRIRNRIANLLPFKLQERPEIQIEMIRNFEVLSIVEWNHHTDYKIFPISAI